MAEPDAKPVLDAIAVANGSDLPKDTNVEPSLVSKVKEEMEFLEEVKVVNEMNGLDEKKGEAGMLNGAVEVKDLEVKNVLKDMKEGERKNDVKEIDGEERTEEGEDKNGVEAGSDAKDTNGVAESKEDEETIVVMEMEGVEGNDGKEDMKLGKENEGSEEKKDEEEKMVGDKMVENRAEGKRENGSKDVEMKEVEDLKEERVVTDGIENDEEAKLDENNDLKEKENDENIGNDDDVNKEAKVVKKKRSRIGRRIGEKGEAKEKEDGEKKVVEAKEEEGTKMAKEAKEKTNSVKKANESLASLSTVERPVRERKTVERLVEVIEKDANKGVLIEKGRGTPLKNIPNVAYKLARTKPSDLKLLHQTLFGRKGRAIDFKNNILQFSGFAWHENDDMQKAKVKEKLDKLVKDTLLDLCKLLNIFVSKSNTRKEDLIEKLVNFLSAPATTDVLLTKQQTQKSRKRQSRKLLGLPIVSFWFEDHWQTMFNFFQKRMKGDDTSSSDEKNSIHTVDEDDGGEEDDNETSVPDVDEERGHAESEKENESNEADRQDDDDDGYSGKGKSDEKKTPKEQNSSRKDNMEEEISPRMKRTKIMTQRKKTTLLKVTS